VIRSFRAGVGLYADHLLIRGWFLSRSIPKDQIVTITSMKFAEWTSNRGSRRLSPLTMFWIWPRSYGLFDRYNNKALESISDWLGHPDAHSGRHVDEAK